MKAIIDIGDEKTGSKSRQRFLIDNEVKLARNGFGLLRSTKIGAYDAGLKAYVGEGKFRDLYVKQHGVPGGVAFESYIENKIEEEVKKNGHSSVVFSFEGLIHLSSGEVDKLNNMLRRYFDGLTIIGFLRRQDRKAVSSYTTRLRISGATDKNILYGPKGNPRGTNYYNVLSMWQKHLPKENICFIDYDGCEDVVKEFARTAMLPGGLDFPIIRQNTSMSAFGLEVLRRFNKDLSHLDKYKTRAGQIRIAIRHHYLGSPLKPSRDDAEKMFLEYRESNKALANALGSENRYFFDEDFSEYPWEVTNINLTLEEVEAYVDKALQALRE